MWGLASTSIPQYTKVLKFCGLKIWEFEWKTNKFVNPYLSFFFDMSYSKTFFGLGPMKIMNEFLFNYNQ